MSQWFERFQAAKAASALGPTCPHDTPGSRDGQQVCTACGEIVDEPVSEQGPQEACLHSACAENAHPRVPTKPTKAPSVSFVSAPGCHVVENAKGEDTPAQYWSDVVQERFWVAPTAAQAAQLAAQGEVVYQPEEIWRLRDLKAADPATFPAKLRAIHQAKTLFGATITYEAPATTGRTTRRVARERPAKPRDPRLGPLLPPCTCGELRHWHDHETERWHCWTCTPPPSRRPSPAVTVLQEEEVSA